MIYKIDTSKPWIPEEFSLEENIDLGVIDWDPENISLYLSEKQKTGTITGTELKEELKDKQPLNSTVLKFLLDNPKLIPEEWTEKYVYFWGTILCSPHGSRGVLYLYWGVGGWRWGYGWPGHGRGAGAPSAVLASPLKLGTKTLDPLDFEIKYQGKEYKLVEK